jgi:hypothetical protein
MSEIAKWDNFDGGQYWEASNPVKGVWEIHCNGLRVCEFRTRNTGGVFCSMPLDTVPPEFIEKLPGFLRESLARRVAA